MNEDEFRFFENKVTGQLAGAREILAWMRHQTPCSHAAASARLKSRVATLEKPASRVAMEVLHEVAKAVASVVLEGDELMQAEYVKAAEATASALPSAIDAVDQEMARLRWWVESWNLKAEAG